MPLDHRHGGSHVAPRRRRVQQVRVDRCRRVPARRAVCSHDVAVVELELAQHAFSGFFWDRPLDEKHELTFALIRKRVGALAVQREALAPLRSRPNRNPNLSRLVGTGAPGRASWSQARSQPGRVFQRS